MYLPSNDVIANIVHRDIDLHLYGHKIWNANVWETRQIAKNGKL